MGIFKSKLSSYSGQFWPDSRISGYTLRYLNMFVIQMPQPHWRLGDKFEAKKQLFNKVETIARTDTSLSWYQVTDRWLSENYVSVIQIV